MAYDPTKLEKISNLITEANEVVGIWEIWIEDCPVNPIKVKVLRMHPQEKYMGVTNYSIQNPEQATPYRSLHLFDTPQEALEDAIRGFLMFYKPNLIKQTKFILDENF